MNQCVNEPSACPFERTRLGKISEMNTQITAPCPMAWKAMNPSRPPSAATRVLK